MNIDKKQYKKYAKARAPKSPVIKNSVKAFLFGGAICAFAEGLREISEKLLGLNAELSATLTSVSLVVVAVLLTAIL